MCTVSFVPVGDKVFITSNRDEHKGRELAKSPDKYFFDSCQMIFPRDRAAGGTWIGLCNNGNAGVLLNGAFVTHKRKPWYRKSRGLAFLEIMNHKRPLNNFLKCELAGVEPFTLILWQQNNLYECRFDENEKKHCRPLPAYRPFIWSSATLYDSEIRKRRELWFANWLNSNNCPGRDEILKFHQFAGDGDIANNLLMNRDGNIFTVSVTSMEIGINEGIMIYKDIINNVTTQCEFAFSNEFSAVK